MIQVMGDYVGVLFHPPLRPGFVFRDQLFIWNWKTGKLVSYLRHPAQGRVRIDSFSFLSPRHFLVTYFQIMPASFVIPSLKVYDFLDTTDDHPNSPKLIRTFELPELNGSAIMISMITRSDPSPAPDDGPAMSSGLPFFTSPASRLMVVGIEIIPEDRLTCGVLLFVHHDTLLDERYPQVVSWNQWGPSNTRLIPMDADLNWVCYVHGTKYVRMGPELSPNGSAPLYVYDFNPLLIRRACHHFPQEESNVKHVGRTHIFSELQPTCIHKDELIFKETVETTLPYRRICSEKKYPYSGVMIDENCIVGIASHSTTPVTGIEFLCI